MKQGVLLAGEPMALFIAQSEGPLECVDGYTAAIAGAEYNVAVGLRRLEHTAGYLTKPVSYTHLTLPTKLEV